MSHKVWWPQHDSLEVAQQMTTSLQKGVQLLRSFAEETQGWTKSQTLPEIDFSTVNPGCEIIFIGKTIEL